MKRLLLAVAMAWASSAQAQDTVRVGTTPGASTELRQRDAVAISMTQTFVAPADSLTNLSIWFYAGQRPVGSAGWFSQLRVNASSNWLTSNLAVVRLDPLSNGRIDIAFETPIYLGMGSVNSFTLFMDSCDMKEVYPQCEVASGPNYIMPALEMTTANAYNSGFAYSGNINRPMAGDVRFEAVFVPEPARFSLALVGIFSLVVLNRSRLRARPE